jgi:hypothetical protein
MPRLPDSVFRATVAPEAAGLDASGLEAAGLDAARLGAAGLEAATLGGAAADAAGVLLLLLDALLQAAATIATAARVRPRPAPRTEVLWSMKIPSGERGPANVPHVMAHLPSIQRTFVQYGTGAGKA